jgi:hypothetical protein
MDSKNDHPLCLHYIVTCRPIARERVSKTCFNGDRFLETSPLLCDKQTVSWIGGTGDQQMFPWIQIHFCKLYIVKDRPALSDEKVPHTNKLTTDSNKNVVLSPKWVLDTKTDWPTDRQSLT